MSHYYKIDYSLIKKKMNKESFVVKKIIYSSELFHILRALSLVNKKLITAKGYINDVNVGDKLEITGKMIKDSRYGYQLQIISFKFIEPKTKKEAEIYYKNRLNLSSGLASSLVHIYGMNFFECMKKNDVSLLSKNLQPPQIEKILNSYEDYCEKKEKTGWLSNIYCSLSNMGLKEHYINKMFMSFAHKNEDKYKKNIEQATYFNVFRLYKIVPFDVLEDIREKHQPQLEYDNKYRIMSGLKKSFNQFSPVGGVDKEILIQTASKIVDKDKIIDNCFQKESNLLFSYQQYKTENILSDKILEMIKSDAVKLFDKKPDIQFTDEQQKALEQLNDNNIFAINGLPGTGKTFFICEVVKNINKKIVVCSFTGRAVSRIKEIGREKGFDINAKTIHYILYSWLYKRPWKKSSKPTCDLLIIDEMSMLDYSLFLDIFKGISFKKLLLVGDINQLMPINAGKVFQDVINIIPSINFAEIKRQKNINLINNFCNVKEGKSLIYDDRLSFIDVDKLDVKVHCKILEIINALGSDFYETKIITSLRDKGKNCCDNLNRLIQNRNKEQTYPGHKFRLNDIVMCTVNNYQKNIFNGEIGIITGIFNDVIEVNFSISYKNFIDKKLDVPYDTQYIYKKIKQIADETISEIDKIYHYQSFYKPDKDDNVLCFAEKELSSIDLAYCITVHKSQGSEFKNVIFVADVNSRINTRRLLYTAITRAKKKVFIIGKQKIIDIAIGNNNETVRNTLLYDFLKDKMNN
jgi:exodeoxyribonuclease V alpha subunit